MIEGATIVGILKDEKEVKSDKIRKFTVTQTDSKYNTETKKYDMTTEYIDVILTKDQGDKFAQAIEKNSYVVLRGDVRVNAYVKDGAARYNYEIQFPNWKKPPKIFENAGTGSPKAANSTPETIVEDGYDEDEGLV